MRPPKTNIQEILRVLILQGNVSILDYPYLSGFRTRISELNNKYGLTLTKKQEHKLNKFGRQFTYTLHILPESQKEKAIKLYKKMTEREYINSVNIK